MPSPFPGMDPYLEHPDLWPDVHHELISCIRELLNRVIRPKYVARVEERVYMADDDDPLGRPSIQIPDVNVETRPVPSNGGVATLTETAIAEPVIVSRDDPVREGRVEIREVATGAVVTVIELLSPSNKQKGAGRVSFVKKRKEVRKSRASWVEIDLLRDGIPHPVKNRFPNHQYLVYSSPAGFRPDAKAWPIRLPDVLPVVGIPLRAPDPDAPLDLCGPPSPWPTTGPPTTRPRTTRKTRPRRSRPSWRYGRSRC